VGLVTPKRRSTRLDPKDRSVPQGDTTPNLLCTNGQDPGSGRLLVRGLFARILFVSRVVVRATSLSSIRDFRIVCVGANAVVGDGNRACGRPTVSSQFSSVAVRIPVGMLLLTRPVAFDGALAFIRISRWS